MKRVFDILFSLMMILLCFAFLWWWVTIINLFATKGHPFFAPKRIGKHKKVFRMLKFRSMKIDAPGKACNAGGVAVSGLEIEQNKKGEKWSFEEVDHKLQSIMATIFSNIYTTACKPNTPYDLVKGANDYAFIGIAEKMLARK